MFRTSLLQGSYWYVGENGAYKMLLLIPEENIQFVKPRDIYEMIILKWVLRQMGYGVRTELK